MFGDLHCHTTFSDGSTNYKDILNFAKKIGLDYIAITDHDTLEETDNIISYGNKIGINVIKGVEVSCRNPYTKRRVHLLCYMPKNEQVLADYISKTLEKRTNAGLIMIEKIAKDYPIELKDITKYSNQSKCIYKSHIMRAFMDYGYDNTIYGDIYQYIFKENREKYAINIDYPPVFEALDVIKKSGSVCVLAHPFVYDSMDLMLDLAKDGLIDGIEINHPKNTESSKEIIRNIAEEYGLILTGGTDYHGFSSSGKSYPLGSFLTNGDNIKKLLEKVR